MKPHINPTLETLFQTTEKWFAEKLLKFAERVTDKLVSKAEQSTITSVQAQCFTAIHSIRSIGSRSIVQFTESLKKHFQTTTLKPSLNDDIYSISHKSKNKLDLLTTKDLEDSLSYETAIEKLHKRNKEAFEHLEVRIYELLKQNGETITENPISAESIISAFRESLDLFDFSPEIRIEVYKLFEQFMDTHLAELLKNLNEQLIDKDILPDIDPDYFIKKLSRQTQSTSNNHRMNDIAGSEPDPAFPAPEEPSGTTYTTAPPDHQFPPVESVPNATSQLNYSQAQNLNQGSQNNSPPQSYGQPASGLETSGQNLNNRLIDLANRISSQNTSTAGSKKGSEHSGTSPIPSGSARSSPVTSDSIPESSANTTHRTQAITNEQQENTSAQLSSLLGYGASGQQYNSGNSTDNNSLQALKDIYVKAQNKNISDLMTSSYKNQYDVNNQYDVSTDELVQAVVNIKKSGTDHQPDSSSHSIANKIREKILTDNNRSSETTELKNKRLFLIDIIETLFDHICSNKNLTPTAIHLFRQLTIPIIHLALIDDTFIDNSHHPARLFLEDFADAALGISSNEDSQNNSLYLKLKKIVELASQEDHINNAFFSDLHDDLERFIQYRKQQANIKSPSSRSQIEKKINAVLVYHTQAHEIPDNLMLILNKVWKKVMLNTWFNDSYNEDDWERSKDFIATLIKSIQPAETDIDIKRLKRLHPVLRQEFEDGLIQINLPYEQKVKLLKYLDILHKNALSADQTSSDPITNTPTQPQEQPVSEPQPDDHQDVESEIISENIKKSLSDNKETFNDIKEVVTEVEKLEEKSAKTADIDQDEVIELITEVSLNETENNKHSYTRRLSVTDYDLIRLSTQAYRLAPSADDRYTEMVKQLEEEDWIEFCFETRCSRAKVTWISDDKTQFNCLTQNNHVVEMTRDALSHCFRNNIATVIMHHSVIENAVQETASTLSPDKLH